MDRVPDRTWKTTVLLFHGSTGSGKSKAALDRYPTAYWKPNNKWWDGYDPSCHDTVIWDDWDPSIISYKEMLRICDRYPLTVEFKGGSVKFTAKTIVFTHLKSFAQLDHPWNTTEWTRRVDGVELFTGVPGTVGYEFDDSIAAALLDFI